MNIGVSLPTRYLIESPIDEIDRAWLEMFPSPCDCLEVLKQWGTTSIELRDVREDMSATDVVAATEVVHQSGMKVTIHLWLPPTMVSLPESFQSAECALRNSWTIGTTSPSAIHGHDHAAFSSRKEAVEATISDLRQLCRRLIEMGSPIEPALELCRHKDDGPIGVTFEELCMIADQVNAPNLGFCWDMGHCLANHVKFSFDLLPGNNFLQKVTHTHIHDLDERGKTHAPLTSRTGPVADQILSLARSGYQGVYNLELEPNRWSDPPHKRRADIEMSFETLAQILSKG